MHAEMNAEVHAVMFAEMHAVMLCREVTEMVTLAPRYQMTHY